MKDNDVWQEKYSSVTEERTEENNCLNCFQYANECCCCCALRGKRHNEI